MGPVARPRPAATVVVVRDGPAGVEAYLQRRPRTMGFAGGLWVFPGGRIDRADGDTAVDAIWDGPAPAAWARRMGVDADQARRYVVAACRETFEEAGVLLADRQREPAVLQAARGALLAGERGFAAMLARIGVRLDTARLRYWAWWLTPEGEPRRYDTRFFVAALPDGVTASAEGLAEVDQERWLPPAEAAADQSMPMLPPTRFTLRDLASYRSVEDLLEAGRDRPVEQVLPRLEGRVLIMPWNERYPVPVAPPDHGARVSAGQAQRGGGGTEAGDRWSERVTRVLAPNPSPMTLEGTNTYVVGEPGSDTVAVIDPGPPEEEHVERVLRAALGRRVELVLLTHTHVDHAEGAAAFAAQAGAPLAAIERGWATAGAPSLSAGAALRAGGVVLEPLPTPGHAADHCCFWLDAERAMFTGDHILGRGTTVVEWPGGDMAAYLDSLEAVRRFEPARLYPGHGPMVGDPATVIREYADHRMQREAQVLAALEAGDRTPAEMVSRIYADVDPALHRFAELSVRAHLVKLVREGRALEWDGRFTPP